MTAPTTTTNLLPPVVTGQLEIDPEVKAADLGVNAEPADDGDEDACVVCGDHLEDGDQVYWSSNDEGHMHAECAKSYVDDEGNETSEPPEPMVFRSILTPAPQVDGKIAKLEAELARFRSERPYVVGFNDGWKGAQDAGNCPVCDEAFGPADTCSSDIELGICHAACLEGSPTVDLDTGEPIDGPIEAYPITETLSAAPTKTHEMVGAVLDDAGGQA